MECKCKIAEPRFKVSENGTVSYCGKCAKKYENKRTSLIYSFANEIKEEYTTTTTSDTPAYYDNSKGSIYQFADNQGLNSYEFDIIKRVIRSRKKGNFKEDLEKTKVLIDLYLKEFE